MNNKKKIFLLCFLTLNFSLKAKQSLNLNSRFDYVSLKDEINNENYIAFQSPDFRLDYRGSSYQWLSYRVMYNFKKKWFFTNNRTDRLIPALEHANITAQLLDNLSLTVGKQLVAIGGMEFDYNSADVYNYSLVGNSVPAYSLGATIYYSFLGQKFGLQTTNIKEDANDQNKIDQKGLSYSLIYYGHFFDKKVNPIFSYSYFPKSGSNAKKTYLALGGRINFMDLSLDLDYLREEIKSDGIVNTSIVGQVVYSIGSFKPLVKIYFDNNEVSKKTQDKYQGLDIALQFYPKEDINYRYHVAYSHLDLSRKSGDSTKSSKKSLIFGVRMDVGILNITN